MPPPEIVAPICRRAPVDRDGSTEGPGRPATWVPGLWPLSTKGSGISGTILSTSLPSSTATWNSGRNVSRRSCGTSRTRGSVWRAGPPISRWGKSSFRKGMHRIMCRGRPSSIAANAFGTSAAPQPLYGWDILDQADSRRHGWKTLHDPEIRFDPPPAPGVPPSDP